MIFVIDNYLFSAKSFYEKQRSEGFYRPDRQKNPNQEATFMAVAKKPAPKKAVKAPTKPAKPVKTVKTVKPTKKAATRKGSKYGCKACGLVVSVVNDCGCATMDLKCCGTPMKKKRPPVKK